MAGTSLELLAVTLLAKTANYTKGIEEAVRANTNAQRSARQTETAFDSLAKAIKGVAAAYMSWATVKDIAAALREQIKEIAQLQQTALKLDMGINTLQALQIQAQFAYVSFDNLTIGIQRMQRNIAEASGGSQRLQKDFKMLGLSAGSLLGKDIESQLKVVFESLKNVENETTRTHLVYELFGRGGAKLMNVIMQGAKGFDEAAAMAKKYGLDISDGGAAAREADKGFMEMDLAIKGLTRTFAIQLAPAMSEALKQMNDMIGALSSLTKTAGGGNFGKALATGMKVAAVEAEYVKESIAAGFSPTAQMKAVAKRTAAMFKIMADEAKAAMHPTTPEGIKPTKGLEQSFAYQEQQEHIDKLATSYGKINPVLNTFSMSLDAITGTSTNLKYTLSETSKQQQIFNYATEQAAKGLPVTIENLRKMDEAARSGDIAKLSEDLEKAAFAAGHTSEEVRILEMDMKGLLSETERDILEFQAWQVEHAKVEASADKLIESFREEAKVTGESANMTKILKLEHEGLRGAKLEAAKAAARHADEMIQNNKWMEEGRKITEQFKSPTQKLSEEFHKLNDAFTRGNISAETYENGLASLQNQFNKEYKLKMSLGVTVPSKDDLYAFIVGAQVGGVGTESPLEDMGLLNPNRKTKGMADPRVLASLGMGGGGGKGKGGRGKGRGSHGMKAAPRGGHKKTPTTFKQPKNISAFGILRQMGGDEDNLFDMDRLMEMEDQMTAGIGARGGLGVLGNQGYQAHEYGTGVKGGLAAAKGVGAFQGDINAGPQGITSDWSLKGNEKFDEVIKQLKELNTQFKEKYPELGDSVTLNTLGSP